MSEGASITDITEDYEHRIRKWKKKHDEQLASNLWLVSRNIYLAEEVERLQIDVESLKVERDESDRYRAGRLVRERDEWEANAQDAETEVERLTGELAESYVEADDLREALSFYANEDNYEVSTAIVWDDGVPLREIEHPIYDDRGESARAALDGATDDG